MFFGDNTVRCANVSDPPQRVAGITRVSAFRWEKNEHSIMDFNDFLGLLLQRGGSTVGICKPDNWIQVNDMAEQWPSIKDVVGQWPSVKDMVGQPSVKVVR